MSFSERQELEISDQHGGSIRFERNGNDVRIIHVTQVPIELDAVDRRKLIDLLNMGEYRELSYEESR